MENDGEQEKLCSVITRVLDPEGKTIGTTQRETQNIPPGGSFTFPSHTSVRDPQLWSLRNTNTPEEYAAALRDAGLSSRQDVPHA